MPYGLAQVDTAEYITEKAMAGNVSDRIKLEYSFCQNENEYPCDVVCECPAEDIFTLSVIIDGALSEEFDFWSNGYAVNVADWVAEFLESEGITDYDIHLSEVNSPDTLYRKSGYSV